MPRKGMFHVNSKQKMSSRVASGQPLPTVPLARSYHGPGDLSLSASQLSPDQCTILRGHGTWRAGAQPLTASHYLSRTYNSRWFPLWRGTGKGWQLIQEGMKEYRLVLLALWWRRTGPKGERLRTTGQAARIAPQGSCTRSH